MGDGSSIHIFEDPWLPRPLTFQPITRATERNSSWTVSKLLHKDGSSSVGWNMEALRDHFLPVDAELIQSIPVGIVRPRDSLIWHYDQKG